MIICLIMVAATGGKGLNLNSQSTRTGCGGLCSFCNVRGKHGRGKITSATARTSAAVNSN